VVRGQLAASVSPSLLLDRTPADAPDQSTNERRAAGERILGAIKEAWEDHQLCMGMITDVLMYMVIPPVIPSEVESFKLMFFCGSKDRVICADHHKPSIYVASMCLFRDHVLRAPMRPDTDVSLLDVLKSAVLFMINLERTGHIIDRQLVRRCIYMLEGLYETATEEESAKLYLTVFQPQFIETSRDFYRAEGERLLQLADAATFCRSTSSRIAEEVERCRFTLSPLSEWRIQSVIDAELIEKRIADVIGLEENGVRHMLDHDRIRDLANVYVLISRIDKTKTTLTLAVQKHITEKGDEINATAKAFSQSPAPAPKVNESHGFNKKKGDDKDKPMNQQTVAAVKWVDDILNLKTKYDDIWRRAFDSDQGMQTSITNSFSEFINSNARSSEYLSLFFDDNLKKGLKGKTDSEVDALLDNGITLLRYVKDKDLFETYYKKHLSRRLLMKRSVSMDAERQMISKMKMEVGNQFTQRLEAMFKDMAVSDDLSTSYRDYMSQMGDQDPKRVELEISVLTSTMWPMEMMSSRDGTACLYPGEIETVKQSFEKFYLNKHSGRKLSWQSGMGTADIRAVFRRSDGKTARHELNVSTYAMIILLLFNDIPIGESLSFEEIRTRTMIPDHDLIRNLQSLAVAPKTRVLKKDPTSKDVKPTDRFFYNQDFQSMFTKVRIGVVSSAGNKIETQSERKETEKKMNDERGGSIEAAIVRVMK
jgi:cullin 3